MTLALLVFDLKYSLKLGVIEDLLEWRPDLGGGGILRRFMEYWLAQAEWWRSRSLEWWAAHITAVYIGGAFMVMGARFDELVSLELNEVGDFSAGVFGPVAFFWLVLGYVQQGRELKLSSQALSTQAEELRASVAQQIELVKATNRTLENYENSLDPLLQLRFIEVFEAFNEGEAVERHRFSIVNSGAYCEKVEVRVGGEVESLVAIFSSLVVNAEVELNIDDVLIENELLSIRFSYFKANGKSGVQEFEVRKNWDEGWWVAVNKKINSK